MAVTTLNAPWTRWREHIIDTLDRQRVEHEQARRERRAQQIEARLQNGLRRELRSAAKRIQLRLTQLEFAHWYTGKRRGKVAMVKFAQAAATPAALYLRIDTVRLPRGRAVTSEQIQLPETLAELGMAVGAPVTSFRHYERGLWLIVERAGGLAAIPQYVEYTDAFNEMPKTAGPLDIPIGFGANRRFYHADISEMPHLLIAGATGFGKSVELHNVICTLIQRATPNQLNLVLIDLKGGTELGVYAGLPHLWNQAREEHLDGEALAIEDGPQVKRRNRHEDFVIEPVVYGRRDDVIPVLQRVYYEVERRLQLFQMEHVRDLRGWNYKHRARYLPTLVVIIDEVANVMLDSKKRGDVERLLADIAARGRAPGVNCIIATQRPSVDVVTGLIKANFPARMAFNTASQVDSRVILDKSDAAGLGIPGRLIYQNESRRYLCQAPFVSEALVDDIVKRVIAGEGGAEPQQHSIGRMDMIGWCIRENDTRFSIDAVYQQFRARGITHADVRALYAELGTLGMFDLDGQYWQFSARGGQFVTVGDDGRPENEITFEDVARWALAENGGRLDGRTVWRQFEQLSDRGARRMIAANIGAELDIDGVRYRVARGKLRSEAARLETCGDAVSGME